MYRGGCIIKWTGMNWFGISASPSQTERQCLEHAVVNVNANALRGYIIYHDIGSDVNASKRSCVAYKWGHDKT